MGGILGGILVDLRNEIPCKEITSNLPEKFEGMIMEINIWEKKWLLFTGYNPKTECIRTFLEQVSKSLNELIKEFGNVIMHSNEYNHERFL